MNPSKSTWGSATAPATAAPPPTSSPSDTAAGARVAFVRRGTGLDRVRVRAAWVSDDDITAATARGPVGGSRFPRAFG